VSAHATRLLKRSRIRAKGCLQVPGDCPKMESFHLRECGFERLLEFRVAARDGFGARFFALTATVGGRADCGKFSLPCLQLLSSAPASLHRGSSHSGPERGAMVWVTSGLKGEISNPRTKADLWGPRRWATQSCDGGLRCRPPAFSWQHRRNAARRFISIHPGAAVALAWALVPFSSILVSLRH
jgi:hypothetical protein